MTNSYTIESSEGADALSQTQQHRRGDGYGVVDPDSGAAKVTVNSGTLGQSDTLQVAPGDILVDGTTRTIASATDVGIDAANSSDPRRDVVYVDTAGAVQVAKGAAEPVQPEDENLSRFQYHRPSPDDLEGTTGTVLAEVWVAAGTSSVTSVAHVRRRMSTIGEHSLEFETATQSELDTHAGNSTAHHTRPTAGDGLTDDSNTFNFNAADVAGAGLVNDNSDNLAIDEVASGDATLSSGSVTVDTGHAINDTNTYQVAINPDDGADIAASLEEGGTNYYLHLEENTTSIGNPGCKWSLLRLT